MNDKPVEELFIHVCVFVRTPKERAEWGQKEKPVLLTADTVWVVWDTTAPRTPFLLVTLKNMWFMSRPEGSSSAETSTEMNTQNTVSSTGNRMMIARLQSIIYVIFFSSCDLMKEKQTYFKQTRRNGQQTAACPKIYEDWSKQHLEAKDSVITSVTSIIYVRMIIQDVSLESVLHTRYVGQTTWDCKSVGQWNLWENRFEGWINLEIC